VIGVDIASANSELFAFQCRGQAQTFVAQDTLIAAITIWKPPGDFVDRQKRYLFVLGTLAGGPNHDDILDGPRELAVATADTINPIPYRFVFDPPLALPYRGLFAFVVQAGDANLWAVAACTEDPYPFGQACRTGPIVFCAIPGAPDCNMPSTDLCFSIEFCGAGAVNVQHQSWGRLKKLYR